MTTRIYKIEKFIPKTGNPVFQVHEETEVGSQVIRLDPRNPTPEELKDADDSFAASQQDIIATLTADKQSLATQVEALEARVAQLLQDIPFNPRIIDASKFYDRLTKDEILTLFSSSDATMKTIAETILAYKNNDWPVIFEAAEFRQMLGYLMQFGTLTETRMAELTRDATREEAYDAE
jgi:hypothetical protein